MSLRWRKTSLDILFVFLIGGQSGQACVVNGTSNGEVVQALVTLIFDTKNLVDGVVEETSDASTPDAADLRL